MNVGVLGLGLIGGSMARAYAKAGHHVFATDQDKTILGFSKLSGVVEGDLTHKTLPACDLVILAVYADASARWLRQHAGCISRHAMVIDCCGIKKEICDRCFPIAQHHGFAFIGGHPMAGSHFSGFKYSRSNLFHGAPMVLVPPVLDDPELLQRAETLLQPCGFGSFSITTAERHDEMIAFTSQMPHILSNAFIKSPTARNHKGLSAGSYKDLTRVAWLNPQMWTELILSNRENVMKELDSYMESISQYRAAIQDRDEARLISLFEEGKRCKEEIDG